MWFSQDSYQIGIRVSDHVSMSRAWVMMVMSALLQFSFGTSQMLVHSQPTWVLGLWSIVACYDPIQRY